MTLIGWLKVIILIFLVLVAIVLLRLTVILSWVEENKIKEKKNDK